MSSSCYSSVNTRIQPVESYQINKSFRSITCCASLCIVYCLIAVSMCLHCPEHRSLPVEFTVLLLSSNPNLNPNPHLTHFFCLPFPIMFLYVIHPVLTLQTCKCVQVPFNICEFLQLLNKFVKPFYCPSGAS